MQRFYHYFVCPRYYFFGFSIANNPCFTIVSLKCPKIARLIRALEKCVLTSNAIFVVLFVSWNCNNFVEVLRGAYKYFCVLRTEPLRTAYNSPMNSIIIYYLLTSRRMKFASPNIQLTSRHMKFTSRYVMVATRSIKQTSRYAKFPSRWTVFATRFKWTQHNFFYA